ncbi:MAG: leucine-rich repeat domain-containing protein, partial [Alistipes sp.]|nr:leucine-rich repeat domain-containing protein [Alistipes sp.]
MKKFFFLLVLLGTLSVGCTKDMLDGLKDIIGNPDYEQPNIADISVPNNQIWYTNGSTTERTKPYNSDVFGANIVSNTFDAKKGCWVIKFDGDVTTIGEMAFSYSRLTSVAIPDSVTEIGVQAFYYCSSLTSVTIPDSVTEIGVQACYYCSSLTSVTIPDSVT